MTTEEVMARSKELGLDMSEWEEGRIQQLVDIVNEPLKFPKMSLDRDWTNVPVGDWSNWR